MRKHVLLSILIVFTFVCFTFAAVDIEFWHYWDGTNGEKLEALVSQFNESQSDVHVKAVFVPSSSIVSKIQTSALSGRTPALAISDIINISLIADTGKLVDLHPLIKADDYNVDDFYSELLTYGTKGDTLVSLPVSSSNLGLFWNKDLFREAGLDPETPPTTWEEIVEFSQIIKEKTGKDGFELYTGGGEGTTWQWQVFLWGANGEFLSKADDYRTAAFNSEAGRQALQFWCDLIYNYNVSKIAPWGLFGRGEAAMVMDGSWMVQFFPNQVSFELGSAVFPHPANGNFATNMGGEQIFLFNKSDEETAAAWEFVKWFTQTSVQVEWDKATGFIPVKKSVSEDNGYVSYIKNTRRLLLPFVEAEKYAQARPPVNEYPEVSDAFAREILKAIHNRVSVEEALGAAETKVNDILQ
ncbi:MAG TPA: ABC transporter substrate-binding protein [Thermotogota bacterium]|nr:ABC transporter substrate-binding protein [Thermotogota bacterium]HPJ89938.1 ABC transporter substrate-binding protein [Thermotogota bacterium]HPR96637.1 ABC transporter substrate-binding protein [Thermotogota bacterium]